MARYGDVAPDWFQWQRGALTPAALRHPGELAYPPPLLPEPCDMRLIWAALLPLLIAYPAAASGLAFVINSGGASISLVDMSSQKELRRIPVLREPHHVALSPDGRSLLVG